MLCNCSDIGFTEKGNFHIMCIQYTIHIISAIKFKQFVKLAYKTSINDVCH